MDATVTTKAGGLAPGVYFGLDEDTYHADPALGSSDIRNLLLSPPDYWWGSPLNPDRDDDENDDTPAKTRGTAMHKLVLEGEEAFDRLYARGPTQDKDATSAEKSAVTKAAKARLLKEGSGRTMLPAKDYDRVAIAGAMVTKNPKLATAFQGGLSEVSIVWDKRIEHGGKARMVRCKCRIDYLKARGLGDLKSITNIKKIEFRRACREAIANYRYDIQAAHYLEGRSELPALVKAGAVYGTAAQLAMLAKIAAEPRFAFQFVFFQAAKAPVTWSVIMTPHEANPLYQVALASRDRGLANYLDYMDAFGPSQIWLMLDEPCELDQADMPAWYAR